MILVIWILPLSNSESRVAIEPLTPTVPSTNVVDGQAFIQPSIARLMLSMYEVEVAVRKVRALSTDPYAMLVATSNLSL